MALSVEQRQPSNLQERWRRRFLAASAAFSAIILVIGMLVLTGWAFDVDVLKHVFPSFVTMKVNTAVLFVALGIGLWFARSASRSAVWIKRILGVFIAGLAVSTLAEYAFEIDLALDQVLFPDLDSVRYPGRMAPATATTFVLFGLALVLQDGKRTAGASRAAGMLALVSASIAVFGYLYDASSLYAIGAFASVALHTSIAFVLGSCALLLARPDDGIVGLFTSETEAGHLMRSLVPAIILVPMTIAWLLLRSEHGGYLGEHLGLALMALSTIISLTVVSSVIAASLRQSELNRRAIEATRERTLKEMELAQGRLQALVDASSQIVWTTDAAGTALEDSPSWRRFTGQTREQMQGAGWREVLHPEDHERVVRLWQDAVRSKTRFATEYRVRDAAGAWRWTTVSAVPLRDASGATYGWIGMNIDITAQKRAEAGRLRQLREIVENSPSGIAMFDREMRYVQASPRWLKDYGLGPDAIGKSHYELFPKLPEHGKAVHRRCLAGATEGKDEEAFVRGDGRVQWVRWKVCPWRDLDGEIAGIVMYAEDITERRRGEERQQRLLEEVRDLTKNLEARVVERTNELALARDRLRGIIALAPNAIISIDGEQRITIFNRGAEDIFGWTQDEVLGERLDLLLPGHLRGVHQEHVTGFSREVGDIRRMAERLSVVGRRKNGEVFPAEASISKLKTDDGFQFTVVLRDITERKQLEDEQARRHSERAVLLKEIHHRVKNNLQVLSSLFYLQASRTEQESVRKLLDESRSRLQSIALIHEKLYRSEQLASIDFGDYLRDLTASLRSVVGVQTPNVIVRVDAHDVFLDIDRAIPCALIVNELVSNAMKHAFPNGRPGEIRVDVRAVDSEFQLEVSDDGIGFPPDLDFQKVTTLGLQLVASLTEQLGGTEELVRGEGTTFRIRFPIQARAQRSEALKSA